MPENDATTVETEAIEGTEESTSASQAEKTGTSKEGTHTVPYERFREVIEVKNDLTAELEAMKAQLGERAATIDNLSSALKSREDAALVVESLRNLANHPKYGDMVRTLDKAVRGIDEEVASGETTKSDGDAKTVRLIEETRAQLTDAVMDQRAELILARADAMAERYLSSLPDVYTDEDKAAISKLWTPTVNWEAIEENPNTLADNLAKSLEQTLEEYGTPRGAIAAQNEEVEPEPEPDPREELVKLVNLDWGKMETKADSKGKASSSPVVSDEEFAEAMGRVMKTSNLLRSK